METNTANILKTRKERNIIQTELLSSCSDNGRMVLDLIDYKTGEKKINDLFDDINNEWITQITLTFIKKLFM